VTALPVTQRSLARWESCFGTRRRLQVRPDACRTESLCAALGREVPLPLLRRLVFSMNEGPEARAAGHCLLLVGLIVGVIKRSGQEGGCARAATLWSGFAPGAS
jgi:hypothetical protein